MRRKNAGFTLAEVILAVAILAVLAAVAIPGAIALQRDLKMAELNDCAREIFLAAQNHLTARQAAGTLGEVGRLGQADTLTLYESDGAAAKLLPTGALEAKVAGGHYVLKLNLDAATMVETFYSEDPFTPEERTAIEEGRLSGSGAADARKAARIGYYWGEAGDAGGITPLLAPWVEIVNGADLTVEVRIPDPLKQISSGPDSYGATLTIRVEDAGDPAKFHEFLIPQGDCLDGAVTLFLDSLEKKDGDHRIAFKSRCPAITPGADIKATATLSVAGNSKYLAASRSSNTENSLFADREVQTDGKDTVSIDNARHLQNLNASFANDGWTLNPDGGQLYVEQISDIVWPASVEYQSIISYGEIAAFNGNGLEIQNLWGNNGVFAFGMNVNLSGIYVVDPKIYNNQSDIGFNPGVGALAGSIMQGTVCDCRVYNSASGSSNHYGITGSSEYPVGGLIGFAALTDIQDSFSALYDLSGNNQVGGLVGYIQSDVTIQNSYATVENLSGAPNLAASFLGGTALAPNATITNCYAVGNISANAGTISGFANGDVSITNSYCAVTYCDADGNPTDVSPTYGFAAGGDNTCAYLSGGFTPTQSAGEAAREISSGTLKEKTRWGTHETVPGSWTSNPLTAALSHPYRQELSGHSYPFPALQDAAGEPIPHYGSWPEVTDGLILSYYEKYTDDTYGFYAAGIDGGTPLNALDDTGKAVQEDGYAILSGRDSGDSLSVTWKTGAATQTTATEGKVTGLALASPIKDSGATYGCAYLLKPGNSAMTASSAKEYRELSCNGSTFWFIPEFAKTAVNLQKPASAPSTYLIRTARQLAALGADEAGLWMTAGLAFIQERDLNFSQYMETYRFAGETAYSPVGIKKNNGNNAGNTPFQGSYDGGGYLITGLDITQASSGKQNSYVGLFGYVGNDGVLKNITFVSDLDKKSNGTFENSRNISGNQYVGALAGYNAGTITNCSVAGFDVSGSQYVGGFVGWNAASGKIHSCSADNAHFAVKSRSGGQYSFSDDPNVGGSVAGSREVGGFVGVNIGTITNAYAVVRLPGVTSAANTTGGFVGTNRMSQGGEKGTGSITNAYCVAVGTQDEVSPDGTVTRDYIAFSASGNGTQEYCYSLNDSSPNGTDQLSYASLTTKFQGVDGWGKMEKKTDGLTRHYSTAPDADQAFYPFCTPVQRSSRPAHYGNWPLKEMNNVSLGYYEIYPANSDGFTSLEEYRGDFVMGVDCAELGLHTLQDNVPILQDGYTLLFRVDDNEVDGQLASGNIKFDDLYTNVYLTWQDKNGTYITESKRQRTVNRMVLGAEPVQYNGTTPPVNGRAISHLSTLLGYANDSGAPRNYYKKDCAIEVSPNTYYIPMPLEMDVTTSNSYLPTGALTRENYYQTLTVTDTNSATRTFRYNPHFARSDVGLTANDVPELPEAIHIRTERQFCLLARAGQRENNSYCGGQAGQLPIRQTRDLWFRANGQYTGTYFRGTDNGISGYQSQGVYLWNPTGTSTFAGSYSGCWDYDSQADQYTCWDEMEQDSKAGHILSFSGTNRAASSVVNAPGNAGAIAGVFGTMKGGAISNVVVKDFTANLTGSGQNIGALVNKLESGTVEHCVVDGVSISVPNGVANYIGGLTGVMTTGTLEDCQAEHVSILVNAAQDSRHIGGLLGRMDGGAITDCAVSVDQISAKRYVGGIVGKVVNGAISGVTVTKSDGADAAGTLTARVGVIGGAIGQAHVEKYGQTITLSSLKVQDVTVSSTEKYTATEYGTGGVIGHIYFTNSGSITVNDQANLAEHVTVNAGTDYAGGFVGAVAPITTGRTLTLENASVKQATVSGSTCAGGFVGSLGASIAHCDVQGGTVTGGESGMAGGFAGTVSNGSSVTKSFSSAKLENGLYLGGFVGQANGGTFQDCYASGTVHNALALDTASSGGFAGQTVKASTEVSTFINCFASGDVNAAVLPRGNDGATELFDGVGGFVGSSKAGDFQQCYSIGSVTANHNAIAYAADEDRSHVGGFIGYGTPQTEANDVLKQLLLFVDVMENTYVVNRLNAPGSLGTLNQSGIQKIFNAGCDFYELTDSDFGNLNQCWTLRNFLPRHGTKEMDSGAFVNGSGFVGAWDNSGNFITAQGDGSLTWNVVRTMNYRLSTASEQAKPFYQKMQTALWRVEASNSGNFKIYWAMPGENGYSTDGTGNGTADWRDDLLPRYNAGQIQTVQGYYFETDHPDVVKECVLKLLPNIAFSRTYVRINGIQAYTGDIILSPTKILPSFYLSGKNQNTFSGYDYDHATEEAQNRYPYSDQYRFTWLERWSASDFSDRWTTSLPDMKMVTDGSGYHYPVPAGVGNVEDRNQYYYFQ